MNLSNMSSNKFNLRSFDTRRGIYIVPEQKLENSFKFKEGANFNRKNTCGILRIKICD